MGEIGFEPTLFTAKGTDLQSAATPPSLPLSQKIKRHRWTRWVEMCYRYTIPAVKRASGLEPKPSDMQSDETQCWSVPLKKSYLVVNEHCSFELGSSSKTRTYNLSLNRGLHYHCAMLESIFNCLWRRVEDLNPCYREVGYRFRIGHITVLCQLSLFLFGDPEGIRTLTLKASRLKLDVSAIPPQGLSCFVPFSCFGSYGQFVHPLPQHCFRSSKNFLDNGFIGGRRGSRTLTSH